MSDHDEGGNQRRSTAWPSSKYGIVRADPFGGAPEPDQLLPASRNFLESLREAAYLYEHGADGGVEGCKSACHAVVRFLGVRGVNPVLAEPFLVLHESLQDVQNKTQPELFAISKEPRPRSRSRQRRHAHLIASACMTALMKLGDGLEDAARTVARAAGRWRSLEAADVDHLTVRNWRDRVRREGGGREQQHDLVVADLLANPDPRRAITEILRDGPPGQPKT